MAESMIQEKIKGLQFKLQEIYLNKLPASHKSDPSEIAINFLQNTISFEKEAEIVYGITNTSNKITSIYGCAMLQVIIASKAIGENVFYDCKDKLNGLKQLVDPIKNTVEGHWLYCYALLFEGEIYLLNNTSTDHRKTIQLMFEIQSCRDEYEKSVSLKPWTFDDILGYSQAVTNDSDILDLCCIQDMSKAYIVLAARYLKDDDIVFEHGIKAVTAVLCLSKKNQLINVDVIDYACDVGTVMLQRHYLLQARHLIGLSLASLANDLTLVEDQSCKRQVYALCFQYCYRILKGSFALIHRNTAKFFQKEVTTHMLQDLQLNEYFEIIDRDDVIESYTQKFPTDFNLHLNEIQKLIETGVYYLNKSKSNNVEAGKVLNPFDYSIYEKYFSECEEKISCISDVTSLTPKSNEFVNTESTEKTLDDIKNRFKLSHLKFTSDQLSAHEYIENLTKLYIETRNIMEQNGIFHKTFQSFAPLACAFAIISVKILQTLDYQSFNTEIFDRLEQVESVIEAFRLLPHGLYLYLITLFYKANQIFLKNTPTMFELTQGKIMLETIVDTHKKYYEFETTVPLNMFQILGLEKELENDKMFYVEAVLHEANYCLTLVTKDLDNEKK